MKLYCLNIMLGAMLSLMGYPVYDGKLSGKNFLILLIGSLMVAVAFHKSEKTSCNCDKPE